MENYKKRWGDRKDGRLIRDLPGLSVIMMHIMPKRTDAEVYINDEVDCTELMNYISEKNGEHPEFKTTVFHALIFAVCKMIYERPKMNRFIQGKRMYQRDEISMSFIVKRQFDDHAEESLMVFVPKEDDDLESVSRKIAMGVRERKQKESSDGGFDSTIDFVAKLPHCILSLFIDIIRWIDIHGWVPMALRDGDTNFTTCILTNLGSIKCRSIYHHLNNYGTNSIVVALGEVKEKDGRYTVDIGVTLDERIGDGFYFARSLKLVKYLFGNPEIMEEKLASPSNFDYR